MGAAAFIAILCASGAASTAKAGRPVLPQTLIREQLTRLQRVRVLAACPTFMSWEVHGGMRSIEVMLDPSQISSRVLTASSGMRVNSEADIAESARVANLLSKGANDRLYYSFATPKDRERATDDMVFCQYTAMLLLWYEFLRSNPQVRQTCFREGFEKEVEDRLGAKLTLTAEDWPHLAAKTLKPNTGWQMTWMNRFFTPEFVDRHPGSFD